MVPLKKAKTETKVGCKRWTANSSDGKFLCQLLKKKEISPGVTPAALKASYPQFQVYKNAAFAAGFRRLKKKYGGNVRANSGENFESFGCFLLLFVASSSFVACFFI